MYTKYFYSHTNLKDKYKYVKQTTHTHMSNTNGFYSHTYSKYKYKKSHFYVHTVIKYSPFNMPFFAIYNRHNGTLTPYSVV